MIPLCMKPVNFLSDFASLFSFTDDVSCSHLPTRAHTHVQTRSADSLQREVTSREVEEFEQRHGVLVLPVDNTAGARLAASPSLPDGRENIKVM